MDPNASSFTPCLKVEAQPFVPSSQATAPVNPSLNVDARAFVPNHGDIGVKPPPVPLCRFFAQGACKKGMDCPFRHDSGAVNKNREQIEEVADQPTLEYDIDDGIHTCFGPGASVIRLDLGDAEKEAEVNTIAISGIPTAVSDKDVEARLSAFGELHHLSCNSARKGKEWYAFAQFASPSMATEAVRALNGTSAASWFGLVGSPLRFKSTGIVSVVLRGRKHRNSVSVSVKVHWFAPSTCAWAHYSQRWQAERVASLVNEKSITKACSIQAKFQQPTRGQRSSFSVWLGNLPGRIEKGTLISFLNKTTKIRCVSLDVNPAPYSESSGPAIVQNQLTRFGPISEFNVQDNNISLKRRALARFVNSEDAKKACDHFSRNKKVQELGGTRLFVTRIFSLKYHLPPTVFPRIKNLIEAACSKSVIRDTRLNIFEGKQGKTTLIVLADTQKSIEAARDSLKEIVEGEVLRDPKNGNRAVWNRRLSHKSAMFGVIGAREKKCAVWVDSRRQEIRVFGPDESRMETKKALLEHYSEIMLETQAVPILPSEFEFLLTTGRSALDRVIRASGAQSISLNIKDRSLLVGAVQEAQKARLFVSKLAGDPEKIEKEEVLCPVCFCSPDDSVIISCGDAYCQDCFLTWLGGSSVRDYPLVCLQEGCHEKIMLRDLQKCLPDGAFGDILRFAVDDHVRKNPDKYQFCLSPTCPGIYELEDEVRVSTCSTCMVEFCTDCNVSHGSLSCEDYRLASLPPDQMRMKIVDDILTLRCPRCRQAFLDFSGCFALRCSMCPCGFCGWCLKDCGSDAHSHVLDCPAKPKGSDRGYFGTFEQFELAQKLNRKRLLIEFLSSKSKSEQISCLASLERDLLDLGISVRESELS